MLKSNSNARLRCWCEARRGSWIEIRLHSGGMLLHSPLCCSKTALQLIQFPNLAHEVLVVAVRKECDEFEYMNMAGRKSTNGERIPARLFRICHVYHIAIDVDIKFGLC